MRAGVDMHMRTYVRLASACIARIYTRMGMRMCARLHVCVCYENGECQIKKMSVLPSRFFTAVHYGVHLVSTLKMFRNLFFNSKF